MKNKMLGEPVAETDAVYLPKFEASESSKNAVWRYYYEESFWDRRIDAAR